MTTIRPRIGFVLEQTLGHITHTANLRAVVETNQAIEPVWLEIPFGTANWQARVPLFNSNWTVRAGIRARRAIRTAHRQDRLDALFIHTQVPAVLAADWLGKIPSVVSLDATPIQYDELGEHYAHEGSRPAVERVKWRANRRAFQRAQAVVAWSSWAKNSVIEDYGIPIEKVIVIPPGVWIDKWARPTARSNNESTVRILFVGNDFVRKGGPTLLAAFHRLRAKVAEGIDGVVDVELHLVTKDPVPAGDGIFVYSEMSPNETDLQDLYRGCHIFCMPTRADMLPLALSEAGAAGLARVCTDVGGIAEQIVDDETGLLVPPDDVGALAAALTKLIEEPSLRRRLGDHAAANVAAEFDATKNAQRVVDLLQRIAADRHNGRA